MTQVGLGGAGSSWLFNSRKGVATWHCILIALVLTEKRALVLLGMWRGGDHGAKLVI